jgi:hypothetical protein
MRKSRKELKEELKYAQQRLREQEQSENAKFSRYMEALRRAQGSYGVLVLKGGQAIVVLISEVKLSREMLYDGTPGMWDASMIALPQPPK